MNDSKHHEAKPEHAHRSGHDTKESAMTSSQSTGAAGPPHMGEPMRTAGASDQGSQAGDGGIGAAAVAGMQRVGQLGTEAGHAGQDMLRGAVSTTEELGTGIVGGATHIATELVHGVTDLGYEVRNGATGLIGAVGDIGSAVVHTATGLLVDVVGGVRQVVNAAVHGSPDGAARQGWSMQQARPYPEQDRPPGGARANEGNRM